MWNMLDEVVLAASIAEPDGLEVLDDLVVTRRLLEADMANVAARQAAADVINRLVALVDDMDDLIGDPVAYAGQDRAFHDLIMQTSGNRLARAVVRALESQVVNTVRYMGKTTRELCAESNPRSSPGLRAHRGSRSGGRRRRHVRASHRGMAGTARRESRPRPTSTMTCAPA
jgi:DNA-binding FadR family transcriptional regulator